MKTPRRILLVIAASHLAVGGVLAAPKPPEPPPLVLPKPHASQVSSSESLPPLPYPVVAMKRQEKKNPPTPPVLITKIRTEDAEDWTRTPNDIRALLEWINKQMEVSFTSNIQKFSEVDPTAKNNPLLYRSGYKPFELTGEEIKRLREYIFNGGTIVFNALVGHPDFYQSALLAARQILPERPVYRLRMDHPLFRSFHAIETVDFRERMKRDGLAEDPFPWIDGVDIDNRTAILISRWDFSLGWEANPHESWGYADESARRLGANIISYVTSMREAGRSVGGSVQVANETNPLAGSFRVGQLKHNGVWQTRAAAFPMLLKNFHSETGTPVSFEVVPVSAGDDLSSTPFLYLTGTTDFSLSPEDRSTLRRFFENGGVLFAEAGDGRASFDAAFRKEISEIFPGRQLVALDLEDPLLNHPKQVQSAKVRPALQAVTGQSEQAPALHAIELNGTYAVIYSPHDLSAGWERANAPYAAGYQPVDATALGMNVLYYGLTH